MSTTTNYGLKMPATTDNIDVADLNYNFNKIDLQMKTNADNAAGAVQTTDIINDANCTVEGKVLDARQANPSIAGSMAADIATLNQNFKEHDGYTSSDIYGVEVDFTNKTFTRLAGAVGKTAGANFDSVNAFGGRKRCNITNDGVVLAYYGDAGFSTTGKLTKAVTVNSVTYPINTIVQVMVEQPKFYYKVVPLTMEKVAKGSITRKVAYYVSDTPKVGFKIHPAFVVNGQENDKIYLSAFEGSLWDASASTYILDDAQVADFNADMLCSIGGAKPMSGLTQNLTRANVRKLAEKRGTGWEQETVQCACASELLMLIEYASFNMKSAIGQGAVNKTSDGKTNMAENTGATISLGNASGTASNANGVQFVTYRGEENFWGNILKWVDGLNQYFDATNKTSTIYICDNNFADDTKMDCKDAGITPALTNGYVSAFCYSEDYDWLFIAGEVLGGSSLPVGNSFYPNNAANSWFVARLGGNWSSGSDAGAFSWNVSSGSYYYERYIGGRLVYRKKVKSPVEGYDSSLNKNLASTSDKVNSINSALPWTVTWNSSTATLTFTTRAVN